MFIFVHWLITTITGTERRAIANVISALLRHQSLFGRGRGRGHSFSRTEQISFRSIQSLSELNNNKTILLCRLIHLCRLSFLSEIK